MTSISLVQEE
jgi:hypothetical protein